MMAMVDMSGSGWRMVAMMIKNYFEKELVWACVYAFAFAYAYMQPPQD